MKKLYLLSIIIISLFTLPAYAVIYPDSAFSKVSTYINPVIPADFPDITLFKDGSDFYACTSSFHHTPYCAVYHSTDLVHWEIISRAVMPTWTGIISDAPAAGMWEGAITKFYDSWWLYFSNTAGGGQYFTKAASPYGPWSTPVKVRTTATTGPVGYDNSIFVDDDGTPYMLTKNGQYVNKIQQVGRDGHLVGEAIDLAWVNDDGKYSWAEGPVMCKRDGWYYYFVAGNVAGGQWVLRTKDLRADSTQWQELGEFFPPVADNKTGFRSPNHISQPFRLDDGTWWCLAHSYEHSFTDDWGALGRQGLLFQVNWDANGVPKATAPTSAPLMAPALPRRQGVGWTLPRSDDFSTTTLKPDWFFQNTANSKKYSLTNRPGCLTLMGALGQTSILQKESGHYYDVLTAVDATWITPAQQAGLYITNGNESKTVKLMVTMNGSRKVRFCYLDNTREVECDGDATVWLRLIRRNHRLEGLFSTDNRTFTSVGELDVTTLDATQENYNSWVGNSIGLYAERVTAHFDGFVYCDGRVEQPANGVDNMFGLTLSSRSSGYALSNEDARGGWAMFGGVDFGTRSQGTDSIVVKASLRRATDVEVWLDDIGGQGTLLGTVTTTSMIATPIKDFALPIQGVTGQHDVYLLVKGRANGAYIYALRLAENTGETAGIGVPKTSDKDNSWVALNGTVLESRPKTAGVYIKQGKKFIIK